MCVGAGGGGLKLMLAIFLAYSPPHSLMLVPHWFHSCSRSASPWDPVSACLVYFNFRVSINLFYIFGYIYQRKIFEYYHKYSRAFSCMSWTLRVLLWTCPWLLPLSVPSIEVNKGIYFGYPSRRHSCSLVNSPSPCVSKMISHIEEVESKLQNYLKQVSDLINNT